MKLISAEQLKKIGKRALAAAAGVVAACSIALGSLANTPDELFSGVSLPAQITAAQTADRSAESNSSRKGRQRCWLRKVFLSQPSIVRGVVLLPFWAAGKVLLSLFPLLFTALSPVLQILLGVLLNALPLFGLFALLFKLLFPNLRWRDIFSKRNILLLAIGSVLLSVSDEVLRAYWADYRPISISIKLGLGLLVLALLSWRILGKRIRPVNTAA